MDASRRAIEKSILTFATLLERSSLSGSINRSVIASPRIEQASKIIVSIDCAVL